MNATTPEPLIANRFLRPRAAAAWLGLSVRTLDRYRSKGSGAAIYKSGVRIRYKASDLLAWTEARRTRTTRRPTSGQSSERIEGEGVS